MADSLLNEFFNPSIPDKRGIQILRGQFEKDKQIKKAIDSGDFSSNLFDFDKEKIFKKCRDEYGEKVWNKLLESTRHDLELSYFYAEFIKFLNDDESTPISKLTKTTEIEIKEKLFISYVNEFKNHRIKNCDLKKCNKTDSIFNKCLKDFFAKKILH